MSRNPVFEPELIEDHEKHYELVKNDIYLLAGADNRGSIGMVAGYHEENDEYEYAQYAQFGTFEQADYACIAISHYLDEYPISLTIIGQVMEMSSHD